MRGDGPRVFTCGALARAANVSHRGGLQRLSQIPKSTRPIATRRAPDDNRGPTSTAANCFDAAEPTYVTRRLKQVAESASQSCRGRATKRMKAEGGRMKGRQKLDGRAFRLPPSSFILPEGPTPTAIPRRQVLVT